MGITCCGCTDRPKGNLYYQIWYLVSKVIIVGAAIILFMSEDFDLEAAEAHVDNIYLRNYIVDISVNSGGCSEGSSVAVLGNWTGIAEGCYCDDGTFPADCSKDGCTQVQREYYEVLTKWRNMKLCLTYDKERHPNKKKHGRTCYEGSKMCGVIDSLGNKLCVDEELPCPINYLTVTSSEDTPDDFEGNVYFLHTIQLSTNKYLHFSNHNPNGFIIHGLRVSEETVCIKNDNSNYYVSNFGKYPLEINSKCETLDNNYIKIDSMNRKEFFSDNDISLSSIPGYPIENDQVVSLYKQILPGLDMDCFNDWDDKFDYDRDYEYDFWTINLSMLVVSSFSLFLSLFTIHSFIKRIGGCHLAYIGFIFVFDLATGAMALTGIVFSITLQINPKCVSSYVTELVYVNFAQLKHYCVLYAIIVIVTLFTFVSLLCWSCCNEHPDEYDIIETKADVDVHALQVTCLCAMEGGKIVSGSKDKSLIVCVVDLKNKTWEVQFEEKDAHDNEITGLCALTEIRFVSCSLDGKVIVWDIAEQGILRTITYIGHKAQVLTVIGLNKKKFLSGSTDCNVIEWNCRSNKYSECIQEEGQVVSLLYLKKSKKLITQVVNIPKIDECATNLNIWNYSKKEKVYSFTTGNTLNHGLLELENELIAVSECLSNSISIIDTKTNTIIKTITNKLIQPNSALCYFDNSSFLAASNGHICRISAKNDYGVVFFGKYEKEFWGQALIPLRVEDYPYGRRYVVGNNNGNGYYIGEFVREDDK